jgi:prepilin-type N-terminal cleavage/methylation domain-containing protein
MQNLRKRIYKQQGFTLVELMVVVAIFMFIIAAVLEAYTTQQHASVTQEQVSDAQQNGQIAMDFLSKEIRMAGFGMPATAVNGFSNAISPAINNDATSGNGVLDGTDQITVVTGYRQISTLANAATQGTFTITLNNNGNNFDTNKKKYVCIDATTQEDNYVVSSGAGNTLTLSSALTRDYDVGAPVFLVKAITYSVNEARVLTRDENTGGGAQTIAPNIEDLQFAYQLADGTWSNAPADPTVIRAVRINVLARTRLEDHNPGTSGTISQRPAIEDHAGNTVKDGYRRRLLTSVVEIRNLGL